MANRFPKRIWIVRHGESTGNVARQAAMDAGLAEINIDHRDIDVPLSETGEQQAITLGKWFAQSGISPDIVLASPYVRARHTAQLISRQQTAQAPELVLDERLREKEFGILDRLTTTGIEQKYPDQVRFRSLLGKFYHRPPAGESWCDVILRLRSLMDTVSLHYAGKDVLIVTHQVVVLCLRYLLERLTEEEILAIDREGDVANCAITEYRYDSAFGKDGGLVLHRYNFVAPLREDGTPVTAEPSLTGLTQ